jgi:hypothetical protein
VRSPTRIFILTVAIGLFAVLAISILLLLGGYGYYQFSSRIVPGVHVGNTELAGMTVSEAAIELQKSWNLENTIQVTNGAVSIGILPEELGVSLDPMRTASRAHDVAHGDVMPAEIMQMLVSLNEGWSINPVIYLDPELARMSLEALAPQLSQAPTNATLRVEGGQVIPVPGEFGWTVNMDATMETLNSDPQTVLSAGTLNATLMPVLPPVMDATTAAAEAQALIDQPVTLYAYDAIHDKSMQWNLETEVLASWLAVEADESGPRAAFDPAQVGAYLDTLSTELEAGHFLDGERYGAQLAEALRSKQLPLVLISHTPTTYTIQPGDTLLKIGWKLGIPYWMILQDNPGIDPDTLLTGAVLNVPSKDDLLPYPVVPGKRIVIGLSKQHIWIYENGERIRDFVISTGIDRSPTQPGVFQIQTHEKRAYASVWDLYMPNFLGIYEAWPGFMNGIHGLPTLSNGRRLWANILGRPASYGCIILDLGPAEWLYNWAENGVVVEIIP